MRNELRTFRRYQITSENKHFYGKETGKGTIIFGTTFIIGNFIQNTTIKCIVLIIGFILFLGISFKASKKYIGKII